MIRFFLNSNEIKSYLVQGKLLGLFSWPLVVDQTNGKAIFQGTLGTGNL